ncbi:hypothetical protein [Microbacterium sp. 77mftsu3.1]|uniref:hypothetical protein n=1 Tax=Microbacterium sp. 77mftsu3.1 TaxID=1761802 RepID=UPI0003621421|nr:hypothetical protein [Microbacterium sp. 77mftsu3.1]SDG83774.1 hypothetical protein SAMN04488590_1933 [Microbacterium sp. 77mftsu3.1]
MTQALDAILEIFTWVGFGAAVVLGVVAVVVWASDGSWLAAEAYLDEDGRTLRWIDSEGDVNSAPLDESDRSRIGADHTAKIWYRHGWHDRMRFTRRPPALNMLTGLVLGGATLGIAATVASIIVFFVRS